MKQKHLFLLSFIRCVPNSFNASETSPEWREVHKKMVEVYLQMSVPPRSSVTLHGHFVELYSALKQGIRSLSLKDGAPKCPSMLIDGDKAGDDYVSKLYEVLISDSKKFQPKKWWSPDVTRQVLAHHLDYTKAFGNGAQDASWVRTQKAAVRSKFEVDQKNWEVEIARKHAIEGKEAAKNRKLLADNSSKLVECLERSLSRDNAC